MFLNMYVSIADKIFNFKLLWKIISNTAPDNLIQRKIQTNLIPLSGNAMDYWIGKESLTGRVSSIRLKIYMCCFFWAIFLSPSTKISRNLNIKHFKITFHCHCHSETRCVITYKFNFNALKKLVFITCFNIQ